MFKILCVTAFASLSGCASIEIPKYDINMISKKSFDKNEIFSEEQKLTDLINFWKQFNDEDLLFLIQKSQENSPTISNALLNIKNYEFNLKINEANKLPTASANASLNRGVGNIGGEPSNSGNVGFKASWEIDLFNKNKLNEKINQEKLNIANSSWHEARTLVAANTAKSYFSYKICLEYLDNMKKDYSSRISQKEVTKLNVDVGLDGKSSEYLADARLAQSKSGLIAKEIECASEIKGLVALTGLEEESLKKMIDKKKVENIDFKMPKIIPGDLITQRPDVFGAKKSLEISYYELEETNLKAYPSISISGNISKSFISTNLYSQNGTTWNIGPLSISMPIFDGGRIEAAQTLGKEVIENKKVNFESSVRQAIKEVEMNLLSLSKIEEKRDLIDTAINNYEKLYDSTLKKYEVGLASLYELEDAKISYLNSLNSKVSNKKETLNSWIDLYKSVGGGFNLE